MNRSLDDLLLWSCAGHALAKYSVVMRFRVREILVVKGLKEKRAYVTRQLAKFKSRLTIVKPTVCIVQQLIE